MSFCRVFKIWSLEKMKKSYFYSFNVSKWEVDRLRDSQKEFLKKCFHDQLSWLFLKVCVIFLNAIHVISKSIPFKE